MTLDSHDYVPPTKGDGGIMFWDGSRLRRRRRRSRRQRRRRRRNRRKTSCPLCNLNKFWNILMILGRNVDKDEMTCRIQD